MSELQLPLLLLVEDEVFTRDLVGTALREGGFDIAVANSGEEGFPPDVIRYAVWLYFRFTLSIRDVEELLAQRGIEVSREAVR